MSSALPQFHSNAVVSSTRKYHAVVVAAQGDLRAFKVQLKSLLKSGLQQQCSHGYAFYEFCIIGNQMEMEWRAAVAGHCLMPHLCIPVGGCTKQDQDPRSGFNLNQLACPWPSGPTCGEVLGTGRFLSRRAGARPALLGWGKEQDRVLPINPPSKYVIHGTSFQQEFSQGPRSAGAVKPPGVSD